MDIINSCWNIYANPFRCFHCFYTSSCQCLAFSSWNTCRTLNEYLEVNRCWQQCWMPDRKMTQKLTLTRPAKTSMQSGPIWFLIRHLNNKPSMKVAHRRTYGSEYPPPLHPTLIVARKVSRMLLLRIIGLIQLSQCVYLWGTLRWCKVVNTGEKERG